MDDNRQGRTQDLELGGAALLLAMYDGFGL